MITPEMDKNLKEFADLVIAEQKNKSTEKPIEDLEDRDVVSSWFNLKEVNLGIKK
jgi:hypothetical protein